MTTQPETIPSPWSGQIAARFGTRRVMVISDLMRCGVLAGFYFADAVWRIYALAVLLNLGSAIFTPIYRAVIPDVVTSEQYPKTAAIGSIAYDAANILSPSMAALVIVLFGFRGNFVVDAITFLASAALLIGLPRLAAEMPTDKKKAPISVGHGLSAMFKRLPLRQSLFLALQTSIAGWGLTYPLAGFLTTALGFGKTAWVFAAITLVVIGLGWGGGKSESEAKG